jgi:hypothetical protein
MVEGGCGMNAGGGGGSDTVEGGCGMNVGACGMNAGDGGGMIEDGRGSISL